MIGQLLAKVIGTQNERELKRLQPRVAQISALEPGIQPLSTSNCAARPRSSASASPTASRSTTCCPRRLPWCARPAGACCNMRHFDVQLIGGMVLHSGTIAEMKTGEGKTLVATLPAYLNALEGKGVHVVTVNDYLARRDSSGWAALYRFLGHDASASSSTSSTTSSGRWPTGRDITYGTNNEFGFDYLRDNMKFDFAVDGAARAPLRDRGRGRQHPRSTRPARRSSSRPAPRSRRISTTEVGSHHPAPERGATTQGNAAADRAAREAIRN